MNKIKFLITPFIFLLFASSMLGQDPCDGIDPNEQVCVEISPDLIIPMPLCEAILSELPIVECELLTVGCTDPSALNYNSLAVLDDGTCIYEECDCDWNADDFICVNFWGSVFEIHACELECGYWEFNGQEEFEIVDCGDLVYGCTDPEADNYDAEATVNDGSCSYTNCDCDWDSQEVVCVDFGNGEIGVLHPCEIECFDWFVFVEIVDCGDIVYGCTDPQALNYNAEATIDDGSCDYEECDCDWETEEFICVDFGWGEIIQIHPCELECGLFDPFFTGNFEIVDCGDIVYGCTDPQALNYNAEATINDGSCEYEECDCDWTTDEFVCIDLGFGEVIQVHACDLECGLLEPIFGNEYDIVDCDDTVGPGEECVLTTACGDSYEFPGTSELEVFEEEGVIVYIIVSPNGEEITFSCEIEGFVVDCGNDFGDFEDIECDLDFEDNFTDLIEGFSTGGQYNEENFQNVIDILIELFLFPNPIEEGGIIEVVVESNADAVTHIQIFNSVGQVVYSKNQNLISGNNRFQVDVEGLEAGVYITTVTSSGKTVTERFIKK